jgi:ubiquinone/menaquinone biosynthesis C-methylase UbiE
LPNSEDEVFRSYFLDALSPNELLIHGDTGMVSKFFLKYILPTIKKKVETAEKGQKIKVIELGGGTCFESYYFKQEVKNAELISTDVSPYALAVSRNLSIAFKLVLGHRCACDAQNLPFPENTFDIVFGTEFLHHCKSLLAATKEIARILRPNGIFLGIEPMCGKITKPIIMFMSGANRRAHYEHILENRYTFAEWKRSFEIACLKVSISAIDDPEIYKSLIGQKCHPNWYNGRYLTKYVYSTFFNLVPYNLKKNAPNATLMILGVKKN